MKRKFISFILLSGLSALVLLSCNLNPNEKISSNLTAYQSGITKFYDTTGYNLVWSDEFNGTSLDLSKWSYDTGGGGWGNNELQYYTSRTNNVFVSDGTLKIISRKESYSGYSYTSGRIKTQGKFSFQYGKIVARIRLSSGNRKGIWPAFWMLGTSFNGTNWPMCGEIDIMENIGKEEVFSTCHWWDEVNGWHAEYGLKTAATINEWHDYELEWDPTYIRARLDGLTYYEILIDKTTAPTLTELHDPMFILLNQAVGGNLPGRPTGLTVFPSIYEIDYVRVYQK